jgi:hemolysin III
MPLLRPRGAPYSVAEEAAHAISHGVGAVLAAAALPALVALAARRGDAWHLVGATIFGCSMVALYAASTFDHAAIYVLIAGTYTPFLVGALRGPLGWTLLGVQWTIAALGIAIKLRRGAEGRLLSTALYLGMGWMSVVAVKPMTAAIGPEGIAWLLAGGLCYTGGVVFYVAKRLKYAHFVWHLCVLAGTLCHAVAVVRFAA